MGDDSPLLAFYSSGHYVVVRGREAQEKLALLGCFGTNVEHATRKENNRRGPSDRLFANFQLDTRSEPVTLLTLHEAFFLAYALGCLTICSEKHDKLSPVHCWSSFRDRFKGLNIHLDFAIEYGVYHYFRSRGWVVKTGENFGANFLLYRGAPSTDHSKYAVVITLEDETTFNWQYLLTFHRVIQSVNKKLLLVYVGNQSVASDDPKCIERIEISCRLFTSFPNTIDRHIEDKTTER